MPNKGRNIELGSTMNLQTIALTVKMPSRYIILVFILNIPKNQ